MSPTMKCIVLGVGATVVLTVVFALLFVPLPRSALTDIATFQKGDGARGCDTIIVLGGTRLPGRRLSRSFRLRVSESAEAAQLLTAVRVVFTGGDDDSVDAAALFKLIVGPSSGALATFAASADVITENESTTTFANLERVLNTTAPVGQILSDSVASPHATSRSTERCIAIVSSGYHLRRARAIVRALSRDPSSFTHRARPPVLWPVSQPEFEAVAPRKWWYDDPDPLPADHPMRRVVDLMESAGLGPIAAWGHRLCATYRHLAGRLSMTLRSSETAGLVRELGAMAKYVVKGHIRLTDLW